MRCLPASSVPPAYTAWAVASLGTWHAQVEAVQQAPVVPLTQEQEQEAKLRARYGGLVPKKGLLPVSRKVSAVQPWGEGDRWQPGSVSALRPQLTPCALPPPVPGGAPGGADVLRQCGLGAEQSAYAGLGVRGWPDSRACGTA